MHLSGPGVKYIPFTLCLARVYSIAKLVFLNWLRDDQHKPGRDLIHISFLSKGRSIYVS